MFKICYSCTVTIYNYGVKNMFDSIEIRKVTNGFVVILNTPDDETKEYVFDSSRKAVRFIKDYVEAKVANTVA